MEFVIKVENNFEKYVGYKYTHKIEYRKEKFNLC